MKLDVSLPILALVTAALLPTTATAQCLVPESSLLSGAARDAIPALTNPATLTAAEAVLILYDDDLVLGVVQQGEARAYPIRILWWHEIVNDVLGGVPITVSYCPLTGSGLIFDPILDGQHVTFGTSGLLFDNNLVMYDRTSESLWSQMMVQGICGSYISHQPGLYPVTEATWAAWKAMHPETTVVSFDTGYPRDYDTYPYGDYDSQTNMGLLFPHSFIDERLALKTMVHGIAHDGTARAYPLGDLTATQSRRALNDQINGRPVLVVVDRVGAIVLSFDRRVRFLNKRESGRRKSSCSISSKAKGWSFCSKTARPAPPGTCRACPSTVSWSAEWRAEDYRALPMRTMRSGSRGRRFIATVRSTDSSRRTHPFRRPRPPDTGPWRVDPRRTRAQSQLEDTRTSAPAMHNLYPPRSRR